MKGANLLKSKTQGVSATPEQVIELFRRHADPERAFYMAAYMKNKFPFLGIMKPERTVLQGPFIRRAAKGTAVDWPLISRLWALPEREFQYLAVAYLSAFAKRLPKEAIDKIEPLIADKAWWDTVDSLAPTIGALCAAYPELVASHILRWAASPNIWLARTAILFQLKYKERTDTKILAQVIRQNSGSKEFFINKAVGWALREYSKTDKDWVRTFIESTELHPLSVREGGKYIR